MSTIQAGELSHKHIGKLIYVPAHSNYPEPGWTHDYMTISMISHSNKAGVKVRVSGGGHVDHKFSPTDQVDIKEASA